MNLKPCSVCVGEKPISGKPCICGGEGTQEAELHGLRLRVFELENTRPDPKAVIDALTWVEELSRGYKLDVYSTGELRNKLHRINDKAREALKQLREGE